MKHLLLILLATLALAQTKPFAKATKPFTPPAVSGSAAVQSPSNLDCKCRSVGEGRYTCDCTAPGIAAAAAAPAKTGLTITSTERADTPAVKTVRAAAATPSPSSDSTATGETTSKGQPIYTGPRGGVYHYSSSGKKVYARKK